MQIGLGIGIPFTKSQVWLAVQAVFTPAKLFESGANGLWLDPSDLTTMFQDSTGTTPVTAVEQPVGLMLDKSGRNNHAFQSTSANRPTLSARYNLLTKTEEFDNTAWTKQSGTVVSNTKVAAPDGSLTAFSIVGNGTSGIFQSVAGSVSLGETTRAVYLRVTAGTATVGIKDPARTQGTTTCNLTTVWQRFSLTETTAPITGLAGGIWVFNIPATGIEMAWPDFRSSNQSSLPYQRVNTATDYDTQGFPTYLKFDGIDDSMQTNSIDFTATDKMTVFAGVRKLSDARVGVLAETSIAWFSNNGSFVVGSPDTAATYSFGGRGTIFILAVSPTNFAAPITNVLTGIGNISGDQAILRVNGAQAAISTADQGTGNYGNYPLYIGARAGNSLFFNGNLYNLIVRGAQSTAAQIESTEQWVNGKTAAF